MAAVNLISALTITRVNLYRGQPGTSVSTVYTVPASTNVKVSSIVIVNTTATPATITMSVVPNGGSAGATNRIFAGMSVAANQTVVVDTPIYMDASDFIAALQGTASALTVTISGETYA